MVIADLGRNIILVYICTSPHLKDECIEKWQLQWHGQKNAMRTSFMANKCCFVSFFFFFFISAKRLKSVHNTAHIRVSMHVYLKSHLIGILKCFKWLISLAAKHTQTTLTKEKKNAITFVY